MKKPMTEDDHREHLALLLRQELERERPELNGEKPAAIACSARELVALDAAADTSGAESKPVQPLMQSKKPPAFVLSAFGGSRPFSPDEIDTVVSRRIEIRAPDRAKGEAAGGPLVATLHLEPLDARVGPRE